MGWSVFEMLQQHPSASPLFSVLAVAVIGVFGQADAWSEVAMNRAVLWPWNPGDAQSPRWERW